MADVKISGLPEDTSPSLNDLVPIVDSANGTTKYVKVSTLTQIFASLSGSQTLTNTEVVKRVTSVTSIGTAAPNSDTTDVYEITAQASSLQFNAPGGSPQDGQTLIIRIKDNGTAQSIAYTADYRAVGITLPTATLGSSKVLYLGLVYNLQDTKWDCLSVGRQA